MWPLAGDIWQRRSCKAASGRNKKAVQQQQNESGSTFEVSCMNWHTQNSNLQIFMAKIGIDEYHRPDSKVENGRTIIEGFLN